MRLTSTVAEYQRLANIDDHASRLKGWTADYEAAHPDVFNIYYSSYSDPGHRNGAVAEVARISPLVREWEAATWSAQPSGPPATRSSTRAAPPGPTNVYQSCLEGLSRRRTNGRSRGPLDSPSRRSALTARRRPATTPRPSSASPSGQRGNCAEQTTIRRARRR